MQGLRVDYFTLSVLSSVQCSSNITVLIIVTDSQYNRSNSCVCSFHMSEL